HGSGVEGAHQSNGGAHPGKAPRPGFGIRHPRDFMATTDQLGDDRLADRSARSGNEDLHGHLAFIVTSFATITREARRWTHWTMVWVPSREAVDSRRLARRTGGGGKSVSPTLIRKAAMNATLWLRISSVVSLLFSVGHTLGGRKDWSPAGETDVLSAMRTVH